MPTTGLNARSRQISRLLRSITQGSRVSWTASVTFLLNVSKIGQDPQKRDLSLTGTGAVSYT